MSFTNKAVKCHVYLWLLYLFIRQNHLMKTYAGMLKCNVTCVICFDVAYASSHI
jgi:hypothetical protein